MQVVNLLVTTPVNTYISYATYFHNNVFLHLQEVPGLHQSTGRCYIFTQVSEGILVQLHIIHLYTCYNDVVTVLSVCCLNLL